MQAHQQAVSEAAGPERAAGGAGAAGSAGGAGGASVASPPGHASERRAARRAAEDFAERLRGVERWVAFNLMAVGPPGALPLL